MQKIIPTMDNTEALSLSQENIWALEQTFPGTPMNNVCATMRIRGRLNVALIQKSLNIVIASDPSLRNRIVLVDGRPRQYSAEHQEVPAPFYDFTMTNHRGFKQWEAAITRDMMPLIDSPLYYFAIFKLGENDGGIIIKTHHIISDGWSHVLIGNRFSDLYQRLLSESQENYDNILLEDAPPYTVHLETEKKYFSSSAYKRDTEFWNKKLIDRPEPVSIKDCHSASVSPVGQRKTFELSELLNHGIYRFCSTHRVAPFSVIYMALIVYLNRITGENKLCIGVPIFNRTNFKEKMTTGMFVSTLPFINEIDDSWSFAEFNQRLTEQWFTLLKHQRYPFSKIMEIAKKNNPEQSKLFNIVLSYQNSKMMASDNASVSFSGEWHYSGYQAEQLCIHLSHLEDEHKYSISYDYLAQIFSEQEIDDLHHYIINILSEAMADEDKAIYKYSIISDREKEQILYEFNHTYVQRYKNSLYQLWSDVVNKHSSRVALIHGGEKLTYNSLEEASDKFSGYILNKYPNDRVVVALLMPKSFELFKAMVGVIRSGNAWVILPTDIPDGRLKEILEDSGARILITNNSFNKNHKFEDIDVVSCEEISEKNLYTNGINPVSLEELAYIVYTSGSTGKPKGVEITQKNLLNFSLSMKNYYGHGAVLSICSTGFDVFVLESAAALLNGRTIVLPTSQEQESPSKLAKLIRSYGVGFIALTPSRLTAFLRDGEFLLALSKLDSIICGGEAFPGDLLQLLKLYTYADIYNQYGPSEATVGVSIKKLNDASTITIGSPMENCRMYLLDKHRLPMPIGSYGELYIGGACVGKGYRNLKEATDKSFLESPFELGETIYRTGDIGRWTETGEIILGGRRDQQIKLRGLRIEPQEISTRIAMHPNVRESAVRIVEQNGQGMIVAYFTSVGKVTEIQLLEFCANYLPSYMIPALLIEVKDIPLTTNGKVDLDRLPLPHLSSQAFEAETEIQKYIVALFKKVLKNDEINANSDYFLNGGDSLNALEIIADLEFEFRVSLRIADMYACRTPIRLEQKICEAKGLPVSAYTSNLAKAVERDSYPLTTIQQSIYFQTQLDPTKISYNMPGAFRLSKEIDLHKLRSALTELVLNEPLLRCGFILQGNKVVQKVISQEKINFTVENITAEDFSQAKNKFVRPFDLSQAPLFRAGFWQDEDDNIILFIDLHHIICDGISSPLLLKRLNAYYSGLKVDDALNYLDYACYKENQDNETENDNLEYWKDVLKLSISEFDVPTDNIRPRKFDYNGAKQGFCISQELSQICDDYCEEIGITSYMFFAGVFGILLSKLSGCEDFLIGTPVSGRSKQEYWNIFGTFINTLPLRVTPNKDLDLAEYFANVKNQVINMLDNQDVPIDELIKLAGIKHSLDKNPLYNVLFSMRPVGAEDFVLGGKPLAYIPIETGTAKLDLNLELAKDCGSYSFSLEYATALFSSSTISFFTRSFTKIISSVLENKGIKLYDVNALSNVDKRNLFDVPNHTFTPFLNLPIDNLIDDNCEENPNKPAVIYHGNVTSYGELKRKSDALAGLLQEFGVKRGDAVAFCLKRNENIPIAMTAINKAGAAYIPTVISLPKDRLEYMLSNSGAKVILCDDETYPKLKDMAITSVIKISYDHRPFIPVFGRSGEDIMHILYTSGSTGKPKGVMIKHSNLANLLPSVRDMLNGIEGNFICIANAIFDTFITETLYQLVLNNTLVMADEEEMMLPWKMAELMESQNISKIQFTPSRLQMCLNNQSFAKAMANIKFIIVCGEVFQPSLLKQLKEVTDAKIITMYGPTEVTVYMTMADLTKEEHITIGKPMANSRVYALDENKRPVLPTAFGELYIAGECVSKGYVNRPDLTESSYLPDPFFPDELMYRSGDIGRLRLDGYYDFGGRKDNQVKMNGQRIELDEITGLLLSFSGVKEAATVAVKNDDLSMTLKCYFVFDGISDVKEIKKYMSKSLPAYMVPSVLIQMKEMPRTPSGKTDLLYLSQLKDEKVVETKDKKSIEIVEKIDSKQVESEKFIVEETVKIEQVIEKTEFNDIEETLVHVDVKEILINLWKSALDLDEIDCDVSFFELGGTSLAALNMLSNYFNKGWSLSLEQFYSSSSINEQIVLISDMVPIKAKEKVVECEATSQPSAKDEKTVLLTGATGFLGAHLISELSKKGIDKIVCLVRGGSKDRLFTNLALYFDKSWIEENKNYLQVVDGDLSKEYLGIDFNSIGKINYILHAAADVRHYVSDNSSVETNTKGTENAIKLARVSGAKLLHISTISVCGEYLVNNPQKRCIYGENDRDIGQNWEENSYVKGKFLAEKLVFDAIEAGLDAAIFRVGRLVGRDSDGKFQLDPQKNTFYTLMRGLMLLDCYPKSMDTMPIELSAVNQSAKCIVSLMDSNQKVFHVFNPQTIPLGSLVELYNHQAVAVNDSEFEAHISSKISDGCGSQLATVIDLWNRLRFHPMMIYPSAVRTTAELESNDFIWQKPEPTILLQSFLQ